MFTSLQFKIIKAVNDLPARAKLEIYFRNLEERTVFLANYAPKAPFPLIEYESSHSINKKLVFNIEPHLMDEKMAFIRLPLEGEGKGIKIHPKLRKAVYKKMAEMYPHYWNYAQPMHSVLQCPNKQDSRLSKSFEPSKNKKMLLRKDSALQDAIHQYELSISDQTENLPSGSDLVQPDEPSWKVGGGLQQPEPSPFIFFQVLWRTCIKVISSQFMLFIKKPFIPVLMFAGVMGCLSGYVFSSFMAWICGGAIGLLLVTGYAVRQRYYEHIQNQVHETKLNMSLMQEQAFLEGKKANKTWTAYWASYKSSNNWRNFSYFGAGLFEREESTADKNQQLAK